MQKKRMAPIEDRTCKICGTVLSSPLRADHERHQKTNKCMEAGRKKGIIPRGLTAPPKHSAANTIVNANTIKRESAPSPSSASHYKYKASVAKQYEQEAKQEASSRSVDLSFVLFEQTSKTMVLQTTSRGGRN